MSLFDSLELGEELIENRVTHLEAQVEDLSSPMQNLRVSGLEVTDANVILDENGFSMNNEQLIDDGKWVADLINSSLDTATQTILGEYTFSESGAIVVKEDDNNGFWFSPIGILAKHNGSSTLAITAEGNVTITGLLLASDIVGCDIIGSVFESTNGLGKIWTDSGGDIYVQGKDDVVFRANNTNRVQVGSNSFKPFTSQAYDLGTTDNRFGQIHGLTYWAGGHRGHNPDTTVQNQTYFLTDVDQQRSDGVVINIRLKKKAIYTCGGLVTAMSATSDWYNAS